MSDTLKGLLIIASVLTVGWILRKIRKNKVKMDVFSSSYINWDNSILLDF